MPLQLEVLSTLADEQALHLLPPLRLLPGTPSSYLEAPHTSGAGGSSFGHACFGGLASAGGPGTGSTRQQLDLFVRLLSEGPLARCVAAAGSDDSVGACATSSSGSKGNGGCFAACSAAVPVVLHRLACACFPGDTQQGPGRQQQEQQQQALLCSILQRCNGGSNEAQQLLGWLLRWDTSAGQPSDAVDSSRLAAIEAACAAAGLDATGLLQATVEA